MNTLTHVGNLFAFIGGLGMFLYGMDIMASGLQKTAGNKMKDLLGYLTNNRILGVLVGALVTAIIQSSSATTVMVVGFVNAGIMNLTQAAGVIMGANVGTTITAWLVSANEWAGALKPDFFAPFILGIGAFIITFSNKQKMTQKAEIAVGFGILFIGLSSMSSSIGVYQDSPVFYKAFQVLGGNPILGILVGAVVTAIIQSSSASVGILQTLALNGVVTTNAAIFITLGQNIGSCVTALISCVGANRTAKRAACIHLLFNVAGAILFGTLAFVLFAIRPDIAAHNITSVEISLFHTFFNITCTLIMSMFVNVLVKLSAVIVPGEDEAATDVQTDSDYPQTHLDDRILESPSFAVETSLKEVLQMGRISYQNICDSMQAVINNDTELAQKVFRTEKRVDYLEETLTAFLAKVNNLALNESQHLLVNDLFHAIIDVERISDHAENLAEIAMYKTEHKIAFSEEGTKELVEICSMVQDSFGTALQARATGSAEYVRKVRQLEDDVDNFEEELRDKHIQRLSNGQCIPQNGVVFLDILSNVERVSDHANNIVKCVMDEI